MFGEGMWQIQAALLYTRHGHYLDGWLFADKQTISVYN